MTSAVDEARTGEDSIPTRASLLGRLKNWEDQESWEDFARTYSRLIRGYAIQRGLTESEASEVEQETLLCVAKTIHQFESDPAKGTFKAWLFKLTRWRIADQFRKRLVVASQPPAESSPQDDTPAIERVAADSELDTVWDVEWRRHVLDMAMSRVRRRVSPKHYQIFDLYGVRKLPAIKVARELEVNVVQVYLIYHRLVKRIRSEIAYLESKLD